MATAIVMLAPIFYAVIEMWAEFAGTGDRVVGVAESGCEMLLIATTAVIRLLQSSGGGVSILAGGEMGAIGD
jgi:hypothetical protein